MTALSNYFSTVIALFVAFLRTKPTDEPAKSKAEQLLTDFLNSTGDFASCTRENFEQFLVTRVVLDNYDQVASKIVSNWLQQFPPHQTNIALQHYLLALKAEDRSSSTIKNYRSDIGQFLQFASESDLRSAFEKPKVINFLLNQKGKGLRLSSARRKMVSMTQFILWAESLGYVSGVSEQMAKISQDLENSRWDELRVGVAKAYSHEGADDSDSQNKGVNSANLIAPPLGNPNYKYWSLPLESINSPELQVAGSVGLVGATNTFGSAGPINPAGSTGVTSASNQINSSTLITSTATTPPATTPNSNSVKPPQPASASKPQNLRARLKNNLRAINNRLRNRANKNRTTPPLITKWMPYINLLIVALFLVGGGFLAYLQFSETDSPLAYPSSLTRPNRTLSFQGRLTDSAKNPINTATDMRFKLYDSGPGVSGGNILWDSSTCSVTPDQDGIFSTGLGDDCGTEISNEVFSKNSNVWLQIEVNNGVTWEVLDPRQSIKTVPYALNTETIQGYPASASAVENTVLVMDNNGNVVLGSANPVMQSTGASFSIEAQTLSLRTASGSNGDIVLSPDGLGQVFINSDLDVDGFISAPGATLSANYVDGKPLVINGKAGQTANLTEWNDGSGNMVVVDKQGRVGIGTTSPSQSLHIASGMRLTGGFYDSTNSVGTNGYLLTSTGAATEWQSAGTLFDGTYFKDGGNSFGALATLGTNDNYGLALETNNTTRVTITNTGNVGIGTTTPSHKLELATHTAASGGMAFGTDVELYRSAANTLSLASGDSFNLVSGNLSVAGTNVITSGRLLQVANGSAAAPSMTFSADTNTGIFGTGSDVLGFSTGGSERMRINSSGSVGIGTTTPNAQLHVEGSARISNGLFMRYSPIGNAYIAQNMWNFGYNDGLTSGVGLQANRLLGAGSGRYTLSCTGMSGCGNIIFDGMYIGRYDIDETNGGSIEIDFRPEVSWTQDVPGGYTYPDGMFAITFYYTRIPGDILIEYYTTISGTDTWVTAQNITGNVSNPLILTAPATNYVKKIRFTFSNRVYVGGESGMGVTEIEWFVSRGDGRDISVIPRHTSSTLDTTTSLNWKDSGWNDQVRITPNATAKLYVTGNVGIGDSTPASLFTVGNGDKFQVDGSGNLIKINNVSYSWPASQAGASGYVLSNNGSGTLSWVAASGGNVSGTGTNGYVTYWTGASSIGAEQYLSTSRGGLGANVSAAGAGELLYSTGASAYGHLASGTSGQILKSGGVGAPSWNTAGALTKTDDSNVTLTLGGSASTALVNSASITVGWNGLLAISRGGTNSSATPTAGAVAYGTGTAYGFTGVGTSGYVLTSGGTGTPTWTDPATLGTNYWDLANGTLYPKNSTVDLLVGASASASAKFRVDATNGNLVSSDGVKWLPLSNSTSALNIAKADGTSFVSFDTTNSRVGIGTTSPSQALEVVGRIKVSDDASSPNIIGSNTATGIKINGDVITILGGGGGVSELRISGGGVSSSRRMSSDIGFTVPYGSAATPSYNFYSVDTDTGMFRPSGNDNLGFSTGGVERFRINDVGSVGIGTTSPSSLLSVGSSSQFQVDGSGNLAKINNVSYSWPASQAGASGYVLSNNGSGSLSWVAASGGNVTGSGTNGYVAYWTGANSIGSEQYLSTSRGGLGANVSASGAGELLYSTSASAYGHLAAGTSGQILKSGGAGAPSWNTAGALTKTDDSNVTLTLGGSASTALVNSASITVGWNGLLAISRGGTNSSATPTAGAIAYGTGTAYGFTGVGTSGQILTSNGSSAPSWSSVSTLMDGTYFKDGGNSFGALATLGTNDNYGLALETNGTERLRIDTSGNVGIGTTTPTHKLELASDTVASGGIAFGTDVELYRSAANTLSLASGDSFNLVSGNLSVAGTNVITSGRILRAADGSATTPSISFSNDANMGLFRAASDNLGFATNSSERMRITSSGSIGIGTTSPLEKLHLVDGTLLIDSPSNPTLSASISTTGVAKDVFISGKFAYIADSTKGLVIVDINDPANPSIVSTLATDGTALGIHVSGKYAYVADGAEGVVVIDISDPSDPSVVGNYDDKEAHQLFVAGNRAYVVDGDEKLYILDIGEHNSIALLGEREQTEALDVYVSGKYAYVADGSDGLVVVDISDPSNPDYAGSYNTSGTASGVYVSGKYAYVADGSAGLAIIDISDPSNPDLVGSYNTSGTASGVYVSGKYAYVADGSAGLAIIDISDPSNPDLVGSYNTSGTASGVYVSGKYAYVADGSAGLAIIDIKGANISALNAGNINTNSLTITENGEIGNNLNVSGALSVGGNTSFDGTLSAGNSLFVRAAVSGSFQMDSSLLSNNWTVQDNTLRYWRNIRMSRDGKYQLAAYGEWGSNTGGVRSSSDYGATWSSVATGKESIGVALSGDGKYQIYAPRSDYIYVSSNYGASWTSKGSSRNYWAAAISNDGKYQTVLVDGGKIYTSSDYGVTWGEADSNNRAYKDIGMSASGKYQTAVGQGEDIYLSSDYGVTWTASGYGSKQTYAIDMSENGKYQTVAMWNGSGTTAGFWVSSDYGATWTQKNSTSRNHTGVAMTADGKYQMITARPSDYVYGSSDYGATWSTVHATSGNWWGIDMSDSGQYQSMTSYNSKLYTNNQSGDASKGASVDVGSASASATLNVTGDANVAGTATVTGKANFIGGAGVDPVMTIQQAGTTTGTSGNQFVRFLNNSGTQIGRIRYGSNTTSVVYATSGTGDFAEWVLGEEPAEPGDVISYQGNSFGKADPGEPLAGIYSTYGTFVAGEANAGEENSILLVMSGVTEMKVNTSNGPIKNGDPLTISPTSGVGMVATSSGQIVARAMANYSEEDPETTGMIKVLLNVGWYDPTQDKENSLSQILENIENNTLTNTLALENLTETISQIPNFTINDIGRVSLDLNDDTGEYQITVDGNIVDSLYTASQVISAKITAGLISAKELIADTATLKDLSVENLKIGDKTLREYIASVFTELQESPEGISEPELAGDDEDYEASGSTTPVAESDNDTLLSNLLVDNNATISGTLSANTTLLGELTAQTATISGQLSASEISTDKVSANKVLADEMEVNYLNTSSISAQSSRLTLLEAHTAEFENAKSKTAELMEATVSGTLYANNIYDFENKIANSFEQPGLIDILKQKLNLSDNSGGDTSGNFSGNTTPAPQSVYDALAYYNYDATSSADLNLTLADLDLSAEDVTLTAQAVFIENYFKVNGAAYIADSVGIGNQVFVGQGTTIADGYINYSAPEGEAQLLSIQPSGQGIVSILAGLMTLDSSGQVEINGDLKVAGSLEVENTLLTNLLQPTDFDNPFQVKVAGVSDDQTVKESRFEIVNELGSPVATISAQGRATFADGISVGSETLEPDDENAPATTDKTSGKATLSAGATEITIQTTKITKDTLVYITPVGSTHNKVLYVKSQKAYNPDKPLVPGKFVVGLDQAVATSVQFNWWLVN